MDASANRTSCHLVGASPKAALFACRECDALLRIRAEEPAVFRCPRCGCVVHRTTRGQIDNALALYLTAGVLFAVANSFPIASIEAAGNRVETTLIGAARVLHAQQMNLVAFIVLATTVAIPAIELLCAISLLMFAKFRRSPQMLALFLRLREALRPWSMVEIFVLGALVAIVKLGNLASVVIGTGIWSLGGFIIASAAAAHVFDPLSFWNEIETPT
jgi:paraquat-inducible protein A